MTAVPVGIFGASGHLGGELLRLLDAHPHFELVYAARSDEVSGASLLQVHPSLRQNGSVDRVLSFEQPDSAAAAQRCRVAFLATPAATSARLVPELLDAGVELVVDLSPAHRLRDPDEHMRWYPDARRDEAAAQLAVYGLPETERPALAEARLVAAPGCFATAIILAMLPLRRLAGVTCDAVSVDAKSGSSGSGFAPRASGMHALRSSVVSPYAPIRHRQTPEVLAAIRRQGIEIAGAPPRFGISAWGVDAVRGLSVSVSLFVEGGIDQGVLRRALRESYRDEPFVRVQPASGTPIPLPDPKATLGSNFCDVGAFADPATGRVVLVGALDNLVKGGAGQAIQAANVRFGFAEATGLQMLPVFPV